MHGKDVLQTTNRNGSENYSGKQNRKDSVSKAVGVGSSPTAPAISLFHILNMYYRKREEKKRYKRLYQQTKHSYCCGVFYKNGHTYRLYKSDSAFYRKEKKHSRRIYRRKANRSEYELNKNIYDLF